MPAVQVENIQPILHVHGAAISVKYYVDVLGFKRAPWGDRFTYVSRDGGGIYLCQDGQGQPGTWVWVGVTDVEQLYNELMTRGARIRHPPRNYSWALEIHVEDLDGNVLRFGSEPKTNRPFEAFLE